jgi:hypothetical protein
MAHGGPKFRQMTRGGPNRGKMTHSGPFYATYMKRVPGLIGWRLSAQLEPLPLHRGILVCTGQGAGNAKWPMVGQNFGK